MNEKELVFAFKFSCISGILSAIVYPLMISTYGYNWWNYALEISFGPLFIISNLGLFFFIKSFGQSFFNILAIIFNSLAGAAILITNIVQKSVFIIGRDFKAVENEISREIIQKTYKLGNLTQLGLDFYFDVLVSIGTIFLALALLRQHYFSKWLVFPGILTGSIGLIINTIKFPIPPASSGLFDPGPLYAIFASLLLIGMIKKVFIKTHKL